MTDNPKPQSDFFLCGPTREEVEEMNRRLDDIQKEAKK